MIKIIIAGIACILVIIVLYLYKQEQKYKSLESLIRTHIIEEHITECTDNRNVVNNMTHSRLLLFLMKRLDIRLCRMCRNFESTPDNPDICKWAFLESKCTDGFIKWLQDKDLEGEEDARLN